MADTGGLPSNPWQSLPDAPPYVLAEDQSLVDDFNLSAADEYAIRLEIFPEPFLGSPDAPVVLVGLNPGFKERDLAQHRNEDFASRSRKNLQHATLQYPFYLLDPDIDRTDYWDKKLRRLIDCFGQEGRSIVANSLLCVEYFPYHSQKFEAGKLRLPSQEYSFALVRRAIERQAVILALRARRRWCEAVPELRSYLQCYTANSVQNPAVSPANFPNGFEAAVAAIKATHA